jgi:uncharacterized membrane protein
MSTTQAITQPRIRSQQFERPTRPTDRVNVGEAERWLCLLGGGALTVFGLSRESLPGLALAAAGGTLAYRGFTGHCPVYGALDINTARRAPATVIPARHGIKVEEAMTINRSAHDLYEFWRDCERLPQFMRHLESVRKTGGNRSHWVARGPMGMRVEWDAEIYNETPDQMIAWRSLEGADVVNTGSIHFRPAPGNRGTEVRVVLKYDPPAGKAGALIAKLFGKDPEGLIREDLCRFKQLMEAGEIASVEGQTSCRSH